MTAIFQLNEPCLVLCWIFRRQNNEISGLNPASYQEPPPPPNRATLLALVFVSSLVLSPSCLSFFFFSCTIDDFF